MFIKRRFRATYNILFDGNTNCVFNFAFFFSLLIAQFIKMYSIFVFIIITLLSLCFIKWCVRYLIDYPRLSGFDCASIECLVNHTTPKLNDELDTYWVVNQTILQVNKSRAILLINHNVQLWAYRWTLLLNIDEIIILE